MICILTDFRYRKLLFTSWNGIKQEHIPLQWNTNSGIINRSLLVIYDMKSEWGQFSDWLEPSKTYVPFFLHSWFSGSCPCICNVTAQCCVFNNHTHVPGKKKKKEGEGQRVIAHSNVFPFISGNPTLYKECCPANFQFYFVGQENEVVGDTGSSSQ